MFDFNFDLSRFLSQAVIVILITYGAHFIKKKYTK